MITTNPDSWPIDKVVHFTKDAEVERILEFLGTRHQLLDPRGFSATTGFTVNRSEAHYILALRLTGHNDLKEQGLMLIGFPQAMYSQADAENLMREFLVKSGVSNIGRINLGAAGLN